MTLPLPSPLAQFKNKRILIWGVGREGISTFKFLNQYLPDSNFVFCDAKVIDALSPAAKTLITQSKNVTYLEQTPDFFEKNRFDVIFKSPGISPFQGLAQQALNQTGIFWSNIALFFELVDANQLITTIGVTGTKGKSTTSMVIHTLLTAAGKKSFLIGNIGQPALDLVEQILVESEHNQVFPVLELSSHQLLHLEKSPRIAVIQGLSPEHLDYYPNVDSYYQAKNAIIKHQKPSDLVLFYQQSPEAQKLADLSVAQTKIGFSLEKDEGLIPTKELILRGNHNKINILPGILIAKYLKISPEVIEQGLTQIKPLSHRLELAATINEVEFYDDSLATTPEATIEALKAFQGRNIILLAGGYERHQDFQQLATTILASKVKLVLAFPTTGKRLIEEIQNQATRPNQPQLVMVKSMPEAVDLAKQNAQPKDIVLLSPAAASFNIFTDYADRGNQFKAQLAATTPPK